MDLTGKESLRDLREPKVIELSLEDVIDILQSKPVEPDLISEIMAARLMNRVPVAHISIERAMKFLIKRAKASNNFPRSHGLSTIFEHLKECDPNSAKFLEDAFNDAVRFFRHNPSLPEQGHFSSLSQYLNKVGSQKIFNEVRYWEIETQEINGIVKLASLTIAMHLEILYALRQLSSFRKGRYCVTDRVEELISRALEDSYRKIYSCSGTTFRDWIKNYDSPSEVISDAIKRDFNIGNPHMYQIVRNAYDKLTESNDMAILYFLNTSKILPPQQNEFSISPCRTWFNNQKSCTVKTPSGISLGIIHQCYDGFWFIECYIPSSQLEYTVASSKEDAINYLMKSFIKPVSITIDGQNSTIYLVGEKYGEIIPSSEQMPLTQGNLLSNHQFLESHESQLSEYKFKLWDISCNIRLEQHIKLIIGWQENTSSYEKAYEGEITNIESEKVTLQGKDWDLHT